MSLIIIALRIRRCIWAVAFLAAGLLSVAQGGTSPVVGFYQVPVPAGNSAWVSGLVGADLFQAAATTVTADTDGKALVTFDAPGWTANQFTLSYAEPQSGTAHGLAIDILSNTTTTLKLDATPAGAGLTAGMVFIVRKHATLIGLLPDGGGLAPFSDTVSIFNTAGQQQNYFWDSGLNRWITVLFASANNVIIRPGQGMVIQAATAVNMTLGKGEIAYVKTTPTKIRANAAVVNLIGPVTPLGSNSTLGAMGMLSDLEPFNDSVTTLTPGSLAQGGTFLSTGTFFVNSLFQNANSTSVAMGAGVVVSVDTAKTITLPAVSVSP